MLWFPSQTKHQNYGKTVVFSLNTSDFTRVLTLYVYSFTLAVCNFAFYHYNRAVGEYELSDV